LIPSLRACLAIRPTSVSRPERKYSIQTLLTTYLLPQLEQPNPPQQEQSLLV
jgi:hypothetical protein